MPYIGPETFIDFLNSMHMKRRYALFASVLVATASLSGCKFGRFVWFNFAGINDYKIFPTRELPASADPFLFHVAAQEKGPKTITYHGGEVAFDDFLRQTESVAFLIIRNDSILYERYFDDYDEASIVPSFSMAKSVLSMLIGCTSTAAIGRGNSSCRPTGWRSLPAWIAPVAATSITSTNGGCLRWMATSLPKAS